MATLPYPSSLSFRQARRTLFAKNITQKCPPLPFEGPRVGSGQNQGDDRYYRRMFTLLLCLCLPIITSSCGSNQPSSESASSITFSTTIYTPSTISITTTSIVTTSVDPTSSSNENGNTSTIIPDTTTTSTTSTTISTTTLTPTITTTSYPSTTTSIPDTTTTSTTSTTISTTTLTPTTTTTSYPSTTTSIPDTTTTSTTTTTTTTTTIPTVDGMNIYLMHCAMCHGEDGEGGTGSNLQISRSSISAITKAVIEGNNIMPAWGDLFSTAEIEQVSSYVKNLQR